MQIHSTAVPMRIAAGKCPKNCIRDETLTADRKGGHTMTRRSGHSASCAAAVVTTPSECACRCSGDLHGGPHTARASALVWEDPDRAKYSGQQVSKAKKAAKKAFDRGKSVGRECTDYVVTHAIDELILTDSIAEQDDARFVLKTLVDPFVDEISRAGLDGSDAEAVRRAADEFHLLCTICVEVLRLVQQSKDLASESAKQIARRIIKDQGEHKWLTKMARKVLRRALVRVFNSTIDLVADPARIKMLQLAGFATCPNVDDHAGVEQYCVRPLVNGWVSQEMKDWIDARFEDRSRVDQRARPRKRF